MRIELEEPAEEVAGGPVTIVALARTSIEGAAGPWGIALRASKIPFRVEIDTGRERLAYELEDGVWTPSATTGGGRPSR